jgi:hypothetical protein
MKRKLKKGGMMQKRQRLISLFIVGAFIVMCSIGLVMYAQSTPTEEVEGVMPQGGGGAFHLPGDQLPIDLDDLPFPAEKREGLWRVGFDPETGKYYPIPPAEGRGEASVPPADRFRETIGDEEIVNTWTIPDDVLPPPNASGERRQGVRTGVSLPEGSVWSSRIDPPEFAGDYDLPEGGLWSELHDGNGNTLGYQYTLRGDDGKPNEIYKFDAEGNLESHVKWNPIHGFWVIQADDPRAENARAEVRGNPPPEGSAWSRRIDPPEFAGNYDLPEGGLWSELHDGNGNILGYQYTLRGDDGKPNEIYMFDAEGNIESHVKWNPRAGYWMIQADDPRAANIDVRVVN